MNNISNINSSRGGDTDLFNNDLRDTVMYYQTTLRNIGLFTSIGIAVFTFSNFFATSYFPKKQGLIRTSVRMLAICIIISVCFMCYHLDREIVSILDKISGVKNTDIIDVTSWHNLLRFIFVVEIMILCVCVFATYHHFFNKKP